jgi:hypothetical protein
MERIAALCGRPENRRVVLSDDIGRRVHPSPIRPDEPLAGRR